MENTSVTAQDALEVMRSWIGKNATAGTHREIIDIYNSHSPLAKGYKVKYTDSWCDATVSAVFIKLNAVDMIGGTECGVERHIQLFKAAGIWEEDGTVTPKPGWIICYNWDDGTQPNDGFADHIGFVESVAAGKIVTIEGNTNNGEVARQVINIGNGFIRGFAKPKYADQPKSTYITTEMDYAAEAVQKTVQDVAQEVIDGKWGDGNDRKARLTAAGYNYQTVQNAVNSTLNGEPESHTKTVQEIAQEVLDGKWGNGDDRKHKLTDAGYDYQDVQSAVNALLDSKPSTTTSFSSSNSQTSQKENDGKTKLVIDVSYAQPNVDWDKVRSQIDGVILRCGYGSDIVSQDDKQWARNIVEVERLGIPYGVYLYSYASNANEIQSEIDHTLRLIKGYNPTLGVFYDLEESSNGFIAAQAAKTWCQKVKDAGYRPGIYCGAYFYKAYLNGVYEAVDALWWIAGYGTNTGVPQLNYKPNPGFSYDAWQYTSVKQYNGINGGVDTSEWYASFETTSGSVDTEADTSISYRAHCQTYGWMPAVKDGAIAGTTGMGKRLEAIKITPPDGVELDVEVHIQRKGWVKYTGVKKGISSGTGSSANDPIMGTVGESLRMEAIRIKCTKNPTGKKLKYQVHCQTYGWMDVVGEGEVAGTTGQSKRMEAIKIWFE